MTKDPALDMLLELAQTQTEDAARRLGALNAQGQDMEARLALLVQYWNEYNARFQTSMRRGLTASDWRNYQEFLNKLDAAIMQQREALASARQRVEAGQIEWRSARRTLKSYDTLAQRHRHAKSLRVARREQKETDEHVGCAIARRDPS